METTDFKQAQNIVWDIENINKMQTRFPEIRELKYDMFDFAQISINRMTVTMSDKLFLVIRDFFDTEIPAELKRLQAEFEAL